MAAQSSSNPGEQLRQKKTKPALMQATNINDTAKRAGQTRTSKQRSGKEKAIK